MRTETGIFLAAIAVFPGAPAVAAAAPTIDVQPGPLARSLTTLGQQAGVDILFSDALIGNRVAARVRGDMTAQEALERLLARTGLTYKKTSDGAFVIIAADGRLEEEVDGSAEAIPEILVIGRRAQNSDIRRTQNDIQPYQVYTRQEVQRAHSDSVDDFARSRLPSNAQIAAPSQVASGLGSTRSEINLRGLGPSQTLVLVDGRRMPNLPTPPFSFFQPDVNGIPIEMIDRIEVLTASAGGIYGAGATSGTVNVVLRRDRRGAELVATTGFTTRGDTFQYRLFGRLGLTPNDGRTDVTLSVSHTRSAALNAGDRDYRKRARQRRFANDPQGFLAEFPLGNAINIFASTPLTLDAIFGGTSLGSTYTSLPLDLSTDLARRNALLVANAGTINIDLPPGVDGEKATIVVAPTVQSLFFNARHDFGGGVEAALDIFATRNEGRSTSPGQMSSGNSLGPNSPSNPFQQRINIAFPLGLFGGSEGEVLNEVQRYTGGLIVPLPRGWRANAEIGIGQARTTSDFITFGIGNGFVQAYTTGVPLPGLPTVDPLGDASTLRTALQAYTTTSRTSIDQSNDFRDLNLRLGGPVMMLPGGTATLALLASERRETIRPSELVLTFESEIPRRLSLARVTQRARSLYGEARLPLTEQFGFLSKLEAQLAVRQDWTLTSLPVALNFFDPDTPSFAKTQPTTLYTAGARFSPLRGLIVRGSIATGALPPTTSQIGAIINVGATNVPDPLRGGRLVGSEATLTSISGGNPGLKPERAQSLSLGIVVTPLGDDGPRLSIDYTRISKRNEIVRSPVSTTAAFIASEALFPGRVTRMPLGDADRASGFSGGPVTRLDLTNANLGRTRIDAVDIVFDQSVRTDRYGDFNLSLRATWEPSFRQRLGESSPWIERVGYSDGPLEVRANGGVDWTRDRLTLGFNAQFYSRYKATQATGTEADNTLLSRQQGTTRIPAQVYFDLSGAYRFGARNHGGDRRNIELRWGLLNVLDRSPPIVADRAGQSYSYYGDPRRRRLQITLDVPLASIR